MSGRGPGIPTQPGSGGGGFPDRGLRPHGIQAGKNWGRGGECLEGGRGPGPTYVNVLGGNEPFVSLDPPWKYYSCAQLLSLGDEKNRNITLLWIVLFTLFSEEAQISEQ